MIAHSRGDPWLLVYKEPAIRDGSSAARIPPCAPYSSSLAFIMLIPPSTSNADAVLPAYTHGVTRVSVLADGLRTTKSAVLDFVLFQDQRMLVMTILIRALTIFQAVFGVNDSLSPRSFNCVPPLPPAASAACPYARCFTNHIEHHL